MSQMLGASNGMLAGFPSRNDVRLWPVDMRYSSDGLGYSAGPWDDGFLWPRSRLVGDPASPNFDALRTGRWAMPMNEGGTQTLKKFQGISRDSTGAVLAGCTVQAFLTANDQFVRQVVSEAGGYFDLGSEFPATAHFLVAYKAGSPDVAGTTVNTLAPV